MNYTNALSFRQALDQQITRVHDARGLSHSHIRKLIVFDRFLARLLAASPDGWILKGGVALTLRWGLRARTTKDLDLGRIDDENAATEHLTTAAALQLNDFFTFAVERTTRLDALRDGAAVRYRAAAQLAGRRFDDVTVDVGFGSALPLAPETVQGTTLLAFAGIQRLQVPTVALELHLAEKVHAYTRSYDSGSSTRVKDLVDLVLAEQLDAPRADRLIDALRHTFKARGTHTAPATLPAPPPDWLVPYRALAAGLLLPVEGGIETLDAAHARVAAFLQPILSGTVDRDARWDPGTSGWLTVDPRTEPEPASTPGPSGT